MLLFDFERAVDELQRRRLRKALGRLDDLAGHVSSLARRERISCITSGGNEALVGRKRGDLRIDLLADVGDLLGVLLDLPKIELGRDARHKPALPLDQHADVGDPTRHRRRVFEILLRRRRPP